MKVKLNQLGKFCDLLSDLNSIVQQPETKDTKEVLSETENNYKRLMEAIKKNK